MGAEGRYRPKVPARVDRSCLSQWLPSPFVLDGVACAGSWVCTDWQRPFCRNDDKNSRAPAQGAVETIPSRINGLRADRLTGAGTCGPAGDFAGKDSK